MFSQLPAAAAAPADVCQSSPEFDSPVGRRTVEEVGAQPRTGEGGGCDRKKSALDEAAAADGGVGERPHRTGEAADVRSGDDGVD